MALCVFVDFYVQQVTLHYRPPNIGLEFCIGKSKYLSVSIAERSKACTVYNRLNIEIAGSNSGRGMDVCLRLSVLCCPVSVEALRWTDPPTKESYQMPVDREVH
jgi:hypothetical protein